MEILLISTQDRCTVCTECTMGMAIVLAHPMEKAWVMWVKWKLVLVRLEVVLILTHDRYMVCTKHTIGSEIILGATDGNPT
jgi:hypothetical protein